MKKIVQVGTVLWSVYFLIKSSYIYTEPFEENAKFFIQFGSLVASLIVLCLLMMIRLAFADYTFGFLVGTRCLATLALL